ncbi:hypothetical protein BpHYR1_046005 [Brachionus plicatilis]|uniref:Uncharacterized protein n=1 Tax=Brachionus plicatilis TaxID=10195 RepID=A0A3M7PDN0_BRAPC|nr:hypothetical protein BpHYR1_046005 [Brachionus plicatilis]
MAILLKLLTISSF